ncbi:hypothetical protein [Sphingobacterium hungaricum]|uniref:Uncharacterized protein n=1 Tax=Sphingobacterium hungaricum TaxID=2082723 RepID=A0A928UXC7_9SPHI|nr:hypothetical protein [Sphingobacterium hungaricum]MBE8714970.1 hypothetical protein [Sphingobacterium hungaricum]
MKLLACSFFFIASLLFSKAQEIQVLKEVDTIQHLSKNEFHLIEEDFDLSEKEPLSILKGISQKLKKDNLESLYYKLAAEANELGANAFTIEEFMSNADSIVLKINVFYLDKHELAENRLLIPYNMICIFGDIDNKPESKNIRFNGDKIIVNPMEYVSHQNEIGEKSTISIGGLIGTKGSIVGREQKESLYYSLKGFSLTDAPYTYGQPTIGFNNGTFHLVPLNFARFLIHVLKQNKL